MANTIQVKRGTFATLPTLAIGEPGWTTDTFRLFVGDGTASPKLVGEIDFLKLAGGTLSGALTLNADPTVALHAATKQYVDAVATGLDVKASVRVATAAALPACTPAGTGVGHTLTADAVGVLTVDGVATVLNDRILVKNQVAGDDNGIYKVTIEGTAGVAFVLTRATDADQDAEVTAGMFTFAEAGTANGGKGWVLTTNNPITVDTTALTFTQFSAAGTTFIGLSDVPANYTGSTLKVVRVNAGETALEFVGFAATYLDDTAGGTNAEVAKAPTSNVMYDHGVATTGVHGASTNTLLHSASTIDGGTFV